MTRCPDDAALGRLIDDAWPAEEQDEFAQHVSGCARCQGRLDDLAGVARFRGVSAAGEVRVESPHLSRVLRCLRATVTGGGGSSAAGVRALPELPPATRPGFIGRLGDIHVRRLVGRGGMGVVYEGLDAALDRVVAVKVLAPHLVLDGEAKARFLREARAAATLTHESVVSIHAVGEADGFEYLVLQFVPGESLAERLDRDAMLPFNDVVRIGAQVARGLAAAHARGLVHRDIKPGNILLDADTGDARIADFGLAKRAGHETLTDVGVTAGTPAYMSPEQATNAAVDERSDLFSLGVVLYHASTGRLPFAAESPLVVLNQIRSSEPAPLRQVNPELPEWFCTLVDRLMEKDPARRTVSAAEVADCLERHAAPVPAVAGRARRVAVAALVLGGLGALAVAGFFGSRGAGGPARPASGFVVDGVPEAFRSLAEAVEAAPDGGAIEVCGDGPYTSAPIRVENKRLTIRAADDAVPRFIPHRVGEGGPLQFIVSNTDLVVKGLDIHWPNPSPQNIGLDLAGARGVLAVTGGRFEVANCRVSCGRLAACIWSGAHDLLVTDSHLVAPAGTCLAWRPGHAAGALRVENNVCDGQTALMIVPGPPSAAPPTLTLSGNTLLCERSAIRLLLDALPGAPVGLAVRRNIIDSPTAVVTLVGLRSFPRSLTNHATMTDTAREALAWTDESNVYRKESTYLAGTKPRQPASSMPSEVRSLAEWLAFWRQPADGSIEGAMRYEPRGGPADPKPPRLAEIEAPTGPLPSPVGADVSRVGPRPPKPRSAAP
jgi:hypothetical protein